MKTAVRAVVDFLQQPAVATVVTIALELGILAFASWALLRSAASSRSGGGG